MKSLTKLVQEFIQLFKQRKARSLRATELSAWTELQIASQMVEKSFSAEQEKISELIIHHTRQMSHIIFAIEDVLSANTSFEEQRKEGFEQSPSEQKNSELKANLRDLKTTLQFLKDLFSHNETQHNNSNLANKSNHKKTIPTKIKEIELALHTLEKSSESLKKIHKEALHNLERKSKWQNHIVSLLEELFRLQTTLGSMKNILLQSRQGRYGPLLETAEILREITIHQESLHTEIKAVNSRLHTAIQNRKELEMELQSIEQSKEFQTINDIQSQEKDLSKQLEKIEDKLFIFFANLKDSLSDLADLNSDYEILEVIKEIEFLQEEPLQFFRGDSQEKVMPLLNWILAKVTSDELSTPEDDQNPFEKRYQELVSPQMKQLGEEFQMLFEQKESLPKRKMQHPMYANAQNLRYRRDHYLSSEEKLKNEERRIKERLGHASSKAIGQKNRFETLAKEHFNKQVEVEFK